MSSFTHREGKHFVLVTRALAILFAVGWDGVRVGIALYEFNDTFNVDLARDAKTGEHLGDVVSEVKDPQSNSPQRV